MFEPLKQLKTKRYHILNEQVISSGKVNVLEKIISQ